MDRLEAAALIERHATIHAKREDHAVYITKALKMAAEALIELSAMQSGWIRTSERLPTPEDTNGGYVINAWTYHKDGKHFAIDAVPVSAMEATEEPNDYWLAIPKLPEGIKREDAP